MNKLNFNCAEIIEKKLLFSGFGKVVRYKIRHELFSGGYSEPFYREVYERANAVTVIPYDPKLDKVVLIEQFRIGAFASMFDVDRIEKSPWLLELVAGIIDKDKTSEEIAYLEVKEETGLDIIELTPIYSYWSSPGMSSECVFMFYAVVDAANACGIHGLKVENEDIKVHAIKSKEAFSAVRSGLICNASSIIALQWLELYLMHALK